MPFPLLPILGLAGLGAGLAYLLSASSNKSETVKFTDRGRDVCVTGQGDVWQWRVSGGGAKSKSGKATSKELAISAALAAISSQALPPAPVEPGPMGGDESTQPNPPPRPLPPVPTPDPVGVEVPVPGSWAGARIRRSGLSLESNGRVLRLVDLPEFVADAFGSFDAFADAPVDIVTKVLQGLLPELQVADARELDMRVVNTSNDRVWISDAIERVGKLQAQLLAPDLDPAVVPYAEDILAEGLFGEEQRISGQRFAYRGRLIYARPAGAGYQWSIRDHNGLHGPSDDVFATRSDSNKDAIAAIDANDAEVAA